MKLVHIAALFAATSCASLLSAQSFSHDISLSGMGNGNPSKTFGLTTDPSFNRLYVAVAGDFMGNNNIVAEIDTTTDTVVRTIQVGNYPEDIALIFDPVTGTATSGAVTNSSDGTVSIWDLASGAVTHTVQLPDPFGLGSCYPFGITTGGPGLWVTTVDGSGAVYGIDTNTFLVDPNAEFNTSWKSNGRPLDTGSQVVVPTTAYTPTWSGSSAELFFTDSTIAGTWSNLMAENEGNYIFPGGQDVVELPNGDFVVGCLSTNARLYIISPDGELIRTIRLSSGGGAHGLALSADGSLLVACDLPTGTISFVDMLNFSELASFQSSSTGQGYQQPNDAVFCNGKVYVTCQGSEEVMVFDNLPTVNPGQGYAGELAIGWAPSPDNPISFGLTVTGNGIVALFVSFDDLPSYYSTVNLEIGPSPILAGWGRNSFSKSWTIPINAPRGLNLFAQGVVDVIGMPVLTTPRVIVLP
ncbi:MAG TPA: hypothetical protein QGG59_00130 [Planctomycetota bacterium]|nr:hypothetical protein [Planctomycetota bacterium]